MPAEPVWDLLRVKREGNLRGLEYHDVLASTNDRAVELIAAGKYHAPFLILADKQTTGRGRGANQWWSAEGALTCSVIFDASSQGLPAERWPLVSLAAGVAVGRALMNTVPDSNVRLKWPNDVYLNDRKACGLLVEVPGTRTGHMVIGIGINVNNTLASAPAELQGTATSLIDTAGRHHDRTDVLIDVLGQLDASLMALVHNPADLLDNWREFCLLTGRTVLLRVGSDELLGTCRGIDDNGALQLETPGGMQRFSSGVVVRFD